jgi:hypothetical protein
MICGAALLGRAGLGGGGPFESLTARLGLAWWWAGRAGASMRTDPIPEILELEPLVRQPSQARLAARLLASVVSCEASRRCSSCGGGSRWC